MWEIIPSYIPIPYRYVCLVKFLCVGVQFLCDGGAALQWVNHQVSLCHVKPEPIHTDRQSRVALQYSTSQSRQQGSMYFFLYRVSHKTCQYRLDSISHSGYFIFFLLFCPFMVHIYIQT